MHIIDRRLNPRGKSLANRQRFIRRARRQIRKAVDEGLRNGRISDQADQGRVRISGDGTGLNEPRFTADRNRGQRSYTLPGNHDFTRGDRIERPGGGGEGGGGSKASTGGDGDDGFVFSLTRDEFLQIFFDDLELPDFIKRSRAMETAKENIRAGFQRYGAPVNLDLKRTMRNSLARRIGLRRPDPAVIEALREELERVRETDDGSNEARMLIEKLEKKLSGERRRLGIIPWIDPIDVRYRSFDRVERPVSRAAMFCIMDVSGSMSEHHKELAKRFFMLLHLFLKKRYTQVDIICIRHTHQASEVDEEAFFYSRESGGTIVSSAFEVMRSIITTRYPPEEWNIYAAQASDGDNFESDNERCAKMLAEDILPLCQHYVYVEIWDEADRQIFNPGNSETTLSRAYRPLCGRFQHFDMKSVGSADAVYPVFREIFSQSRSAEQGRRAAMECL